MAAGFFRLVVGRVGLLSLTTLYQDLWCTNNSNSCCLYSDVTPHSLKMSRIIPQKYRGADKSLARPWKETSYSDQDLQHYTKLLLFVHHKSWYSVVSLGRCSLFPSRVGLRTYQHSCTVSHHEFGSEVARISQVAAGGATRTWRYLYCAAQIHADFYFNY